MLFERFYHHTYSSLSHEEKKDFYRLLCMEDAEIMDLIVEESSDYIILKKVIQSNLN
ncbi:succinate dehydrogenase assembly factor 2 [Candidatus Comchoanobacter bicostacola]|uniref:succinate dehydrogenase assembly factor 2 n=1 Tax=Candidatus Comchoanobacter bicostacola TaxID=2919598 RepID=UPI003CCE3F8C